MLKLISTVLLLLNICQANKPIADWKNILVSDTLDIQIDGKQTGVLRSRYLFDSSDIEANVHLSVENSGIPMMEVVEKRRYDLDGNLKHALQQIKSPSGNTSWELTIKNELWECTVVTAGVRNTRTIKPVNENLVNIYSMYSKMKTMTLCAGDTWIDTIIELTSGESVTNTTSCIEVPSEKNSFRWILLTKNSLQGKDERWELDQNRRTVYHEVTPFIAVKRGYLSSGKNKSETASGRDLFESFAVHVNRAPTQTDEIIIQIDSSVVLDSSILTMYKKEKGKFKYNPPAGSCDKMSTIIPDSLKKYLIPTATLQIEHPDIIALGKKLNQNDSGICKRIQHFTNYVFKTLKKQNTATFSSAVETLNAGFGDCGEHAVLLAALLRVSGIPARVVLGLVYLDSKKGYFGHAWVMAFTGDGWVFTDPALGVFGACHERIPLLIDDTGQKMVRLVGIVGKIKIEIKGNN